MSHESEGDPAADHRPQLEAARDGARGELAPARFLRGGQAAGGPDRGSGRDEADALRAAAEPQRLLDLGFFHDKPLLSDAGAEHKVFLWQNRYVVKHTWPGTYGFVPVLEEGRFATRDASAPQYRHRLRLQNAVFGDAIREEGTISLPYEKGILDPQGESAFACVTSQPFRSGCTATLAKVGQFMEENGFRKAPHFHVWYRPADGILAADAHIGNFVEVDGALFPIDLHLNQVPPQAFVKAGWPI